MIDDSWLMEFQVWIWRALVNANFRQNSNRESRPENRDPRPRLETVTRSKLQTLNSKPNQIKSIFWLSSCKRKLFYLKITCAIWYTFGNRAVRILNSSSRKSTSCWVDDVMSDMVPLHLLNNKRTADIILHGDQGLIFCELVSAHR